MWGESSALFCDNAIRRLSGWTSKVYERMPDARCLKSPKVPLQNKIHFELAARGQKHGCLAKCRGMAPVPRNHGLVTCKANLFVHLIANGQHGIPSMLVG